LEFKKRHKCILPTKHPEKVKTFYTVNDCGYIRIMVLRQTAILKIKIPKVKLPEFNHLHKNVI
jgi:hypothetical protein